MELEVRHLRALCAIADSGSLHKAARQLGMSQPSLTTQLRRIEHAVGGQLFTRERTGCRPTPLGRTVLSRARPLVIEMRALVTEARAAAARSADGEPRLRIGSTASRAIPGWLRRLRASMPGTETSLQMDVSANALLRDVAEGRLDVAFVHEVEGSPLRFPDGLARRVLIDREPQFVSLAADHPAAREPVISLADLADDRWMVDPTVDGEWDGLRRMLRSAGLDPRVLHGDYLTAATLVATGEVVTVCQPTSVARPDMAVRPLHGDPLGVRLYVAARTETELNAVYGELEAAYWEAAAEAPAYQDWLLGTRGAGPPAPCPPVCPPASLPAPPPDRPASARAVPAPGDLGPHPARDLRPTPL
ncbi:HTH-type transcriptional regulator BenM [Streptomyces sp. YIM 121038]|uniref:LysR family transcriptional regulator n=1 Tax=Streptomyces sp. YIM 121038 TaxID=2136401 RepID=UPI00111014EA|nr:LysR family transcriptional regulator [Streptomyces sp. YIM 121038]QCX77997.1 HTH-type transcriptional regulator BenM [Streptomyces sp. YIM 121038]